MAPSAARAVTGRSILLAACAMLAGGCGDAGARQDAAGNGGADAGMTESGPSSSDLGQGDSSPADASGAVAHELGSILGMAAFNEPMNQGFVRDLVPSWSSDGLTFAGAGRLSGAVTLTAAGPLPTADAWRDVLFWNVVGEFPSDGDAQFIPLSPIAGVVASTSTTSTATFAVDGAFDPDVHGASGGTAGALAFALTWVRVYRTGTTVQYQVLPGWRDAGDGSTIAWDRSTGPVSGPLGYYAPLADSPALGAGFDYPSWIGANVTWQ